MDRLQAAEILDNWVSLCVQDKFCRLRFDASMSDVEAALDLAINVLRETSVSDVVVQDGE